MKHPQFKEVPADTKKANKAKLAEILPITENLKKKLLDRYKKEYEQYLVDQETERKRALEEAKRRVRMMHEDQADFNLNRNLSRSSKLQGTRQQAA